MYAHGQQRVEVGCQRMFPQYEDLDNCNIESGLKEPT